MAKWLAVRVIMVMIMGNCSVWTVGSVGLITTRGHSKEVVIAMVIYCNSYDGTVGRKDYLILGMTILIVQVLPLL